MTYVMVDIEADGPAPGLYSMTSFGAVIIDDTLDKTFYAELRPVSYRSHPDHLKFSGKTREQIEQTGEYPIFVMERFREWLRENCKTKPIFVSDNNGFDWMFICWYFHLFQGDNPMGYSSLNLNSIYKGLKKDLNASISEITPELEHNALSDALVNARAFNQIIKENNIKLKQ